ncbi:hypothetical protein D3C86_1982160 [compost metagenome]
MQRVLIFDKTPRRLNHPLGARFTFILRKDATAALQAIRHMGIGGGQLRHWRLMRQPARTDDQYPLVQSARPLANRLAEQACALEAR